MSGEIRIKCSRGLIWGRSKQIRDEKFDSLLLIKLMSANSFNEKKNVEMKVCRYGGILKQILTFERKTLMLPVRFDQFLRPGS